MWHARQRGAAAGHITVLKRRGVSVIDPNEVEVARSQVLSEEVRALQK
jgi:hypothetical protein